jgi:hypothetical protein
VRPDRGARWTEIAVPVGQQVAILGLAVDVDTVCPPYFVRRKVKVLLPLRPVEDQLTDEVLEYGWWWYG